jgi:hypothetical protein
MTDDPAGLVDLAKAAKAVDDMRQRYIDNPASRKATLRATAQLVKDAYLEGRIGRFTFAADEPPARGGNDQAPSPLEYFLIGSAF